MGSMALLSLILPIQEHGISFHLFGSSAVLLIIILQFSACRSFVSLVKFIPKYYILFFLLVLNRIVFLLSLSYSSSLMYRKATDLCVSILYPEILQVLLMFFITRFKWRLSHVAQEPEGLRYHFRIIYCIWWGYLLNYSTTNTSMGWLLTLDDSWLEKSFSGYQMLLRVIRTWHEI